MRFVLGGATFACLAFFGLGSLRGDLDQHGGAYAMVGFSCGLIVVALAREVVLKPQTAWRWARVSFGLAVALLAWGFLALILGRDPITGAVSSGRGVVLAETLLMLSTAPAFAGFLLLGMRSR